MIRKGSVYIIIHLFLFLLPIASSPLSDTPARSYTLEDLTDAAVRNNRELRQLAVEEEKTLVDLRSAKAEMFPDIGAEIRLNHIANPIDPITVTAGEFGSYPIAGEEDVLIPPEDVRVYEGMESMFYQLIVSLEQPVFTWGKIRNSIDLYKKVLQTRRLGLEKKREELTATINIYLYSLYYIEKIEELIEEQKKTAERLVFISEKAYENGFIVYSEFLEAQIQAKEINLAEYQLREQKEQTLLDLSHTTLIEDLTIKDLDLSYVNENTEDYHLPPSEELMQAALKNNLDLQVLSSLKEVANYKLEIAEGKGYLKPDIGIRFELSYGGPRFPLVEKDWYGQDDYNLISTIGFVAKIFDGGKLRSEIELNEEEVKASTYDFEQGRQSIEKFIARSLLKLSLYRDNMEYYKLKIESGKEQVALKKTQLEAGAGQESDYLEELINQYADTIKLYQEKIQFFSTYFLLQNVVYGR